MSTSATSLLILAIFIVLATASYVYLDDSE